MQMLRSLTMASLLAGAVAISVDTILLALADRIPLVTARGGLLELLMVYIGPTLAQAGNRS